jgi:biopolymer transport protein ExbB
MSADFWAQTDLVGRAVALLLLAMSVSAWALIFWKTWLLRRPRQAAAGVAEGRDALRNFDTEALLLPLLDAATAETHSATLEAAGRRESRLTRRLRDALHAVLAKLQFGQVLLASVGATAPFVGLFGTVWGIYHALVGISAAGNITIDKISGPVGEALVMTAAGLAVAIPAVLAYNVFGKLVAACEADLEGFAHDLRELLDQDH